MPDSQPNYLTTDSQGRVGANFTGKLSAIGIDFAALGSFGIPEDKKEAQSITWHKDTISGVPVARVTAYSDAELQLRATNPAGGALSALMLNSAQPVGNRYNAVSASADYNGTTNPSTYVDIIRGDGGSDFMRALNTQAIHGLTEGYAGANLYWNPMYRDGGGSTYMQLGITTTVNSWWLVILFIGIIQKLDAAYQYAYSGLQLSQFDQRGVNVVQGALTQHASVNMYEPRTVVALWKLAKNVSYTCNGFINSPAGSWTYYMGPQQLQMHSILWQQ